MFQQHKDDGYHQHNKAKVAAFTTANIRHRSVAKWSSQQPTTINESIFKSDSLNSLNSVDSGNYSFSQQTLEKRAGDESDEMSRIRRNNNIKRVIISEKISPYQLKIQQSKGIKLIKSPPVSQQQQQQYKRTFWFSTAAIQPPPTIQSHQQKPVVQKPPQKTANPNDESNEELCNEEDIEFLLANTGFSLDQINTWCVEFMTKCKSGNIAYEQFKV